MFTSDFIADSTKLVTKKTVSSWLLDDPLTLDQSILNKIIGFACYHLGIRNLISPLDSRLNDIFKVMTMLFVSHLLTNTLNKFTLISILLTLVGLVIYHYLIGDNSNKLVNDLIKNTIIYSIVFYGRYNLQSLSAGLLGLGVYHLLIFEILKMIGL
jgi:hypothetical protein